MGENWSGNITSLYFMRGGAWLDLEECDWVERVKHAAAAVVVVEGLLLFINGYCMVARPKWFLFPF